MNYAITLRFLTPYISSTTRDQDFVHSPLPLDGALAHAAYWEALTAGEIEESPTGRVADERIMEGYVNPVLDGVLERIRLGNESFLGDSSIKEWVYAVSSGFPVVEGQVYVKYGARWLDLTQERSLSPEFEIHPVRKRVDITHLSSLRISRVSKRGRVLSSDPETGKGTLKAIDNRITTWLVYDYIWFADIKDTKRLKQLLEILRFQGGLGKKRSAGFGRLLNYEIERLDVPLPGLRIEKDLFLLWNNDLVLLRPLPYDAVTRASRRVVMTNLVVESGCGYHPPYWSDRRVVVREGTIFRFI